MAPTKSKALISAPPKIGEEKHTRYGQEKLLSLLDPVMINALSDLNVWHRLNPETAIWLSRTVAKFPWFNHLALATVIYANSVTTDTITRPRTLNSFLRWAIPNRYANVASLDVEAAIIAYFGDPPQLCGREAFKAYRLLQFHVTRYLEALPHEKRTALRSFLFPSLSPSRRLGKLAHDVTAKAQVARKTQAFAVVKILPELVALGRQRYRWLAELDAQVQLLAASIKRGEIVLPAVITLKDLEGQEELSFRVWDRMSWIESHRTAYREVIINYAKRIHPFKPQQLFLQMIGNLPENSWFLRATAVGVLQSPSALSKTAEGRKYLQEWHLSAFHPNAHLGLLSPDRSMGKMLQNARRTARGAPDDSQTVFAFEPLLAAAAVAQFILVSIISTGMRIGELQQVTLDRECMESGHLPRFDDRSGTWGEGPKRLYWNLYPKGREKRERYLVTPYMTEAMFILLDLHKRYYGENSIKLVRPASQSNFRHTRRFSEKHKFVLQWGGFHIPIMTLERCLNFLLLENVCRDENGHPVHITAHILRHGVAGWLRKQGISLDEIMILLKQVNIAVTDYYSKLSPEDLHRKLGPALTALAQLAGTEPATVRTVGELQTLTQETLKRYGALRHTPGGLCSVFMPCDVQFKCASCPHYLPDPARRGEIQEKIASLSKGIQLFGELGDYLQADVERAHRCDWERIIKEMDALEKVQIVSPPASAVLKDMGMDDLGDVLLHSLDEIRSLPPQEDDSYE